MSNRELLKNLIQDVINDRTEQAAVSFHNYCVPTTQAIIGLATQPASVEANDEEVDSSDDE